MDKQLLEFSSATNVILRAASDFRVNDLEYKKGDVVLFLEDVDVSFTYNENIKDKTVGGRNLMAYDVRKLNAVLIASNPLTLQYVNIFAKKVEDSFTRTVIEDTYIEEDKTFIPIENIVDNTEIFINGIGAVGYTRNENDNSIILNISEEEEFAAGEYLVMYKTLTEKPCYDVNNNYTIPYLTMEITGQGNVDKVDGNVYINIPRVSLLTRPDYSLGSGITMQDLAFKIIDDEILLGVY